MPDELTHQSTHVAAARGALIAAQQHLAMLARDQRVLGPDMVNVLDEAERLIEAAATELRVLHLELGDRDA